MLRRVVWYLSAALLVLAPRIDSEAGSASDATTSHGPRQRLSLDRDWYFHLGDISFPKPQGIAETYESVKTGNAGGAAGSEFDDSAWRHVNLPHDWGVEGPFDPSENVAQGYRPRGVGWYRRHFRLPESDRGKNLELQFDGVATHCVVWVNGVLVKRNWSGYNSFTIDVSPIARYGDEANTIAVRVDANPMEGWWYEGAGIYRHVWLVKRSPLHIATDGIFANPVKADDRLWKIPLEITLASCAEQTQEIELRAAVHDPSGKVVQSVSADQEVEPFEEAWTRIDIPIESPELWSIENPVLYEVCVDVAQQGQIVDTLTVPCGFRTVRFDAKEGFYLNDRPLKLKGVCNHQDHAGVGVAVPNSLWEYRLRRLKEMGANAYRCAHHPPSEEFLDCCDQMGILVIDENRNFSTSEECLEQLEWLVRRDRNHPSIFLWSIFNEEPLQGTTQGYEMARRMVALVKGLDSTRPVTAAQSNSLLKAVNSSQATDVTGVNYQQSEYDRIHSAFPDKPMLSTEDTSAVMTRGEYATNRANAILSSYDTEFLPWGSTHRQGWKAIAQRPFVAGGFVWTGFDYHGESQPLEWPATLSSFGCMDLCGFPKTGYYLRQAYWIEDRPILQLVPHWNWQGKEGQPIKVLAISNADAVELSLNGISLGLKQVDPYEMVSWEVPYEPGILEATALTADKRVAQCSVATTGPPASLQLLADRSNLAGNGRDAIPITVRVLDEQGLPVPDANLEVEFSLAGPGEIIGLGNGNPNCHEPEQGTIRSLFNGLAQVIVQSHSQAEGVIRLTASAEGLDAGEVEIQVTTAPQIPEVPAAHTEFSITQWQMSPLQDRPAEPLLRDTSNSRLEWSAVHPGRLQEFGEKTCAIYRAQFRPNSSIGKTGGKLIFSNLVGRAQIWIDGSLAAEKNDPLQNSLSIALPPGNHERHLAVLIEAVQGAKAGIGGPVVIK